MRKRIVLVFSERCFFEFAFFLFITVILVVVGILLAIILTIVAFTIWKFLRQRSYQDNELDDKNFRETLAGRKSDDFSVPSLPVSAKSYRPQMPYQNEMVRTFTEVPSWRCYVRGVLKKLAKHKWKLRQFFFRNNYPLGTGLEFNVHKTFILCTFN